jgi:hypothetical protein
MAERAPQAAAAAAAIVPTLTELALFGLGRLVPESAAQAEELAVLRRGGRPGAAGWADDVVARNRSQPAETERALVQLAAALGLGDAELLLCALALRVETDIALGRALGRLQGGGGAAGPVRPTLGLAGRWLAMLGAPLDDCASAAAILQGRALRSGLLRLARSELPLAERTLAIHSALIAPLLRAGAPERDAPRVEFDGVTAAPLRSPDWELPPTWLGALRGFERALASAQHMLLVLRTRVPHEGCAIATRLAARLRRVPVELAGLARAHSAADAARSADPPPGVEPWLLVHGALPVIVAEVGPGETVRAPRFALYRGPVVVVMGLDGTLDAGDVPQLDWTAPMPDREERALLWRSALAANRRGARADSELADKLAREIRCGVASLQALASGAVHRALQRGGDQVEKADVQAELTSGTLDHGLSALARRTPPVPREALVTPSALAAELELAVQRCASRESLVDGLGVTLQSRYSPGLKFLFVGASGTGKTLAAQWLAGRLGKPLYRVDVACVTSKYIGETEKNLAQLLARAEQIDCLLLFDEADSLFGNRTEVRQANDRFANAQTNYLLERIESFEGVAVLTSNSKARFDDAFMRRLDAVIEFPLPAGAERRDLWRAHLGEGHGLADAELNQLAAEVELAGGHIRNVVLTAALLAKQRAAAQVERADVLSALALEYAKLGRHRPDG